MTYHVLKETYSKTSPCADHGIQPNPSAFASFNPSQYKRTGFEHIVKQPNGLTIEYPWTSTLAGPKHRPREQWLMGPLTKRDRELKPEAESEAETKSKTASQSGADKSATSSVRGYCALMKITAA